MYEQRFYRDWTDPGNLESYEIKQGQSDLFITCPMGLRSVAERALNSVREVLTSAIAGNEQFLSSLRPVNLDEPVAPVVEKMGAAGRAWGVGPMASVAGAVAEHVGRALIEAGAETVIVENGGDIFCSANRKLKFALYAGLESPFGDKLAFRVDGRGGVGVCTSSGSVGPSLSFGSADAVVVVAKDAVFADSAATAIANEVKSADDVQPIVERFGGRPGLMGLIICAGDKMGAFGDLELSARG